MSHKLGMAHRCQLITGSFKGNERGCTCLSPADCKLTETERNHYKMLPSLLRTAKENREIFDGLLKDEEIVPEIDLEEHEHVS